ncbi:unnamed protein product [Thelazia callipaeda]|uniref:Phosphatidate cytidylyltransferase, mitochondrial n=1 Tax=Thelazia callipaeda TaxID=103827 RepID=A0A0N5CK77_THECL|nr:unnamed protein product [Thelazia callipaeda]
MREIYRSLSVIKLQQLLHILPLNTVEYACAYGSGAVPQGSNGTFGKMIDLLVVTRDSSRFHQQNLEMNPRHYSSLRFLGYESISQLQKEYAARVYCNTHLCFFQDQIMKYSVIDVEDLLLDLTEWRWLYVAGRLHKYVIDVINPSSKISSAIEKNRWSALQAALLFLPDKFTLLQLYEELISLSYRGDFRMVFGEDKNKIKGIAVGSKAQLNQIYIPLLKADTDVSLKNDIVEQDTSDYIFSKRILNLPLNVLWNLQKKLNKNGVQRDIEDISLSLARQLYGTKSVAEAIEDIVRRSAWQQTVKNALSAGVTRSIVYSFTKIIKMIQSMK